MNQPETPRLINEVETGMLKKLLKAETQSAELQMIVLCGLLGRPVKLVKEVTLQEWRMLEKWAFVNPANNDYRANDVFHEKARAIILQQRVDRFQVRLPGF